MARDSYRTPNTGKRGTANEIELFPETEHVAGVNRLEWQRPADFFFPRGARRKDHARQRLEEMLGSRAFKHFPTRPQRMQRANILRLAELCSSHLIEWSQHGQDLE